MSDIVEIVCVHRALNEMVDDCRGDIVRMETFFAEEGRLAARRDWLLTDAATKQHFGAATSTWVTIDIAKRKLSKLPDDMRRRFLQFSPKQKRNAVPTSDAKRKLPEFELPAQIEGPVQVSRVSTAQHTRVAVSHLRGVTACAAVDDGLTSQCSE